MRALSLPAGYRKCCGWTTAGNDSAARHTFVLIGSGYPISRRTPHNNGYLESFNGACAWNA